MSVYFTGSDVVLRFLVKDNDNAITPLSATLKILKPDETWAELGEVTIDGNTVYGIIPNTQTNLVGSYMALFNIILPANLIRQHKIVVSVIDALARP